FSDAAPRYRLHPPVYPRAVVDFLAAVAPSHHLAWDAGCGSGQLSVLLAGRFGRVLATDASAEQIAHAARHPVRCVPRGAGGSVRPPRPVRGPGHRRPGGPLVRPRDLLRGGQAGRPPGAVIALIT